MMVEISHISPKEVKEYSIGAILNGGGSFPYGKKNHTVEDWRKLADEYYLASKGNNLGIPVIWGTDAVHGHNNLKGAVLFPHNIGLGATRNLDLVREISSIVAKEVYLSGEIKQEFLGKRKKLERLLRYMNYDTHLYDFENPQYLKKFDFFLLKDVGYDTIESLTIGLFINPYAVTSL